MSKHVTREEWIAALRSGKYKQGTGILKDRNDNFCCLGVAADLAGIDWEEFKGREARLMTSSFKQVGLDYLHADLELDLYTFNSLAGANDNGRTFVEIADALELPGGGIKLQLMKWDKEREDAQENSEEVE